MLAYKLTKDPHDAGETLFVGKLTREIKPGLTVLTGCNGSGKSTILRTIQYKYQNDPNYEVFVWNGLTDKRSMKDKALHHQNFELLAQLSMCSEGEEINTNLGVIINLIGSFVRNNEDKDVIILFDGIDSGFSVDNIIELKDFLKELLIKDIEKSGHKCYVIASANEYELAAGERCIDARSGKEISFENYDEYKEYIIETRRKKDRRRMRS